MVEKYEDRLLFLRGFVSELIINSKQEKTIEPEIEVPSYQETTQVILPKKQVPVALIPSPVKEEITIEPGNLKRLTMEIDEPKPIPQKPFIMAPKPIVRMPSRTPQRYIPSNIQPMPRQVSFKDEMPVVPQVQPLPRDFNLGRINNVISDPRVTVIECSGPGKIIVVRIFGRVSPTKIILNQEEIKNIIDEFSKASKIPIIGGLFKSAVGNLVITAVISDLVGSRFVITKMTPAFSIEQMNKGY